MSLPPQDRPKSINKRPSCEDRREHSAPPLQPPCAPPTRANFARSPALAGTGGAKFPPRGQHQPGGHGCPGGRHGEGGGRRGMSRGNPCLAYLRARDPRPGAGSRASRGAPGAAAGAAPTPALRSRPARLYVTPCRKRTPYFVLLMSTSANVDIFFFFLHFPPTPSSPPLPAPPRPAPSCRPPPGSAEKLGARAVSAAPRPPAGARGRDGGKFLTCAPGPGAPTFPCGGGGGPERPESGQIKGGKKKKKKKKGPKKKSLKKKKSLDQWGSTPKNT